MHRPHPQVTTRQAHVVASEKMLAAERAKMADLQKGIRELKVRSCISDRLCVLGGGLCVRLALMRSHGCSHRGVLPSA